MGTPGQNIINDGLIANTEKARFNRAGVAVTGVPPEISKSDPPDTVAGYRAINTDEQVDLVLSRRDKSNVSIRFFMKPEEQPVEE